MSKLKEQKELKKLSNDVKTLAKMRDNHHRMTHNLLVERLKEESDLMKNIDKQMRYLKKCAERRLEVLNTPVISGVSYHRCTDCKECVAMSRGTQTWTNSDTLGEYEIVPSSMLLPVEDVDAIDKRIKRLGSKLDLVCDKTSDIDKRTTCLHHNSSEFKKRLGELEDDLRYLSVAVNE